MRKYERLERIHENTLPPRAHYIPYDTHEKALRGVRGESAYYRLLNGVWDFKYFSRDIDCPDCIQDWDQVAVPSCWQNTGYEKPYYTNLNYPYPVDPPYVPDDNPLGVYRTWVNLTEEEAARKNYLVFEGVSSCMELYVNGDYVGFSTVSHSTSEFAVTLQEGENEILVKVYKWCVASYLEDQDFLRCNGIFRDVYLLSRPEGHIYDISVSYNTTEITVKTGRRQDYCDHSSGPERYGPELPVYRIYDADGKETDLGDPILWNAEEPYLYTVVLEQAGEYIPVKVGLRDQRVSESGELLINGVSVMLRGINHHDTHPENGYVLTEEELRSELLKMKELNINTIRTSHYPPQPVFLELCDELGFYVVDEADLETHGFASRNCGYAYDENPLWPCQNKEWEKAFVDRAARLYERDKNHTCVVMFSLGNESNYGENFASMSTYIRRREAESRGFNRLVHYENCYCNGTDAKDPDTVDVVSRMYGDVESRIKYYLETGENRPFFLCEFSHAMGNGPGDVLEYWQMFEKYPYMIGGCIWEWADHVARDEQGHYCYGGDFGEETHDGNFCCDGLVFHDRTFKAGSMEVKYAYQPMSASWESGVLSVKNKYDFRDFSDCDFLWEVTADGAVTDSGSMKLSVAGHGMVQVPLPLEIPVSRFGSYLNLFMLDKEGREVAFEQMELCKGCPGTLQAGGNPANETVYTCGTAKGDVLSEVQIREEGEYALITGKDFCYRFNLHYGRLEEMGDLLKTPMELTIWKAPTDNERNEKLRWYEEKYHRVHTKVYGYEISGNRITLKAALAPVARDPFLRYETVYTFRADGSIDVELEGCFNRKRTSLPRLGFSFKTAYKEFTYFGYGPRESYIDMHHGSRMGLYESSAEKEYVPYIKPQEHGSHYDTKYLKLGGFGFVSQQGFSCNVSEYSAEELTAKAHYFELERDEFTNVRIDYKVSGIGSASCGTVLRDRYRVNDGKVNFAFSIQRI